MHQPLINASHPTALSTSQNQPCYIHCNLHAFELFGLHYTLCDQRSNTPAALRLNTQVPKTKKPSMTEGFGFYTSHTPWAFDGIF